MDFAKSDPSATNLVLDDKHSSPTPIPLDADHAANLEFDDMFHTSIGAVSWPEPVNTRTRINSPNHNKKAWNEMHKPPVGSSRRSAFAPSSTRKLVPSERSLFELQLMPFDTCAGHHISTR